MPPLFAHFPWSECAKDREYEGAATRRVSVKRKRGVGEGEGEGRGRKEKRPRTHEIKGRRGRRWTVTDGNTSSPW